MCNQQKDYIWTWKPLFENTNDIMNAVYISVNYQENVLHIKNKTTNVYQKHQQQII